MADLFSGFAATLITIPVFGYLIIFIIAKQATKNHRRSVQWAMDFSTLPFIFSVHFLVLTIWNKNMLWLLLIFMLMIAILVVVVHYNWKGEIDFRKVLRGFWRLNFVFFVCMYMILALLGMVIRMAQV
ncbi:DUF3397 domain-containing protein [Bacillus massiliglaciei]|uniref:DUF3397 domain-containing protein n=1 Tax=Bacillus massiliglaciei TaxID=1816693 RepID=UPI000DA62516|nr:DUF3397 domain-containing protein [Bacillus massiliglaciei]